MQFKGFTLDPFQTDAIESVEKGNSVVVSAATGTGKTLIADYVIDKYLKEGKRVVYTAPIKALSNQKYRDFCEAYGKDNVGIITGDVQINPEGQVLIMTTEIYRNMLLSRDKIVGTVSYVVFDEIHYLSDIERGTIWEEAVIFSPRTIRFLCLSATIPNAKQFAAWISEIKGHDVDVVRYAERAVPLKHMLYDIDQGITTPAELKDILDIEKYNKYERVHRRRGKKHKDRVPAPYHVDILKELEKRKWLPCFYFIFSRMQCENKAEEAARKLKFTTDIMRINDIFRSSVPDDMRQLESVRRIKGYLSRGIGVHHAGMLPQLKDAVERCFVENLVSVLYTTETFAVGINMPAKSVVFHQMEKYDGQNTRFLNSKEYFQLAGRAGRRGLDKEGYAIARVDRKDTDLDKIKKVSAADTEPIVSRFTLSYNTVLHLFAHHNEQEIKTILNQSFYSYIRKQKQADVRMTASYNHKLKHLRKTGYVTKHELTERGEFLLHIYNRELLIGEIFSTPLWKELDDAELLVVIAAITYEERRGVHFKVKKAEKLWQKILQKIAKSDIVVKEINKRTLQRLTLMVSRWAQGADFIEILDYTTMMEGDIIHFFRRMTDVMRQIRHAALEDELVQKMDKCMDLINRDVVKAHI